MSDERKIEISTDFGWFGFWLFAIVVMLSIEATPDPKDKNNGYRMGNAVACGIGGAPFCPKVKP